MNAVRRTPTRPCTGCRRCRSSLQIRAWMVFSQRLSRERRHRGTEGWTVIEQQEHYGRYNLRDEKR